VSLSNRFFLSFSVSLSNRFFLSFHICFVCCLLLDRCGSFIYWLEGNLAPSCCLLFWGREEGRKQGRKEGRSPFLSLDPTRLLQVGLMRSSASRVIIISTVSRYIVVVSSSLYDCSQIRNLIRQVLNPIG